MRDEWGRGTRPGREELGGESAANRRTPTSKIVAIAALTFFGIVFVIGALGSLAAYWYSNAESYVRSPTDFAPQNAAATLRHLSWSCETIALTGYRRMDLCPISRAAYNALRDAVVGDGKAKHRLAQLLAGGQGSLPLGPQSDQVAAAWYGLAAEQGHVAAALELNRRRREGQDIPADEAKIAAALAAAADQGDTEAMRALAPMRVDGRGGPRDPAQALSLLQRAVGAGATQAAMDLARLYIEGASDIPRNYAEAARWLGETARRGDVRAMTELAILELGGSTQESDSVEQTLDAPILMHFSPGDARNPAEGYRWLTRAALTGDPGAQDLLAALLTRGAVQDGNMVIDPDVVAADMWLRLAARTPRYDDAAVRMHLEPKMTSAQLDRAKGLAAEWRPRPVAEVSAMKIDPPPMKGRMWPAALQAAARTMLDAGGDHAEPWQALPDFTQTEQVMAAIAAIAAHCDRNGWGLCTRVCRGYAGSLAPPIKPGGLKGQEFVRFWREHPDQLARAQRTAPATPQEAVQGWLSCANYMGLSQ